MERSSPGAIRGHTMRTVEDSGGRESPASAATAATGAMPASASASRTTTPISAAYADRPDPNHGRRPEPVDLPAGDRRPDPDRHCVERHHDSRGPVAPALAADEEEQRKRCHAEWETAEQRPAEHRPCMREAEQRAVMPGAAQRATRRHVARTTSAVHGAPDASRTTPPDAVRGCTVSVVDVTVTCA